MRWPLVRVTWLDSSGPDGWTRLKKVTEPHDLTIESVGWLVQETEDRIIIVSHVQMDEEDDPCVDGTFSIPLCAIKLRTVLQEAAD